MNAISPPWQTSSQRRHEAIRSQAAEDYRLPQMPPEYRFALLRDLTHRCKPLVFTDGVLGLARCIHRMRDGRSLQLDNRRQRVCGEEEARLGVLVYTRDADRHAMSCLGWAWLDGGDRDALRDALHALVPDISVDGQVLRRWAD